MTNRADSVSELVQAHPCDEAVSQARAALIAVAEQADHVSDFVAAFELGDNVVDFRFASAIRGYEGWQWSITMYHDGEENLWTINESALLPTSESLLAPEWVPWKDRVLPSDISPTDVLGTDADDKRLEPGFSTDKPAADPVPEDKTRENTEEKSSHDQTPDENSSEVSREAPFRPTEPEQESANHEAQERDIIAEFDLSRSRVLSPEGRALAAQRWYNGPHGPKSLSTRVAKNVSANNTCQTCGFFVSLKGELGTMFGVCANKWSQDDGRVVSLDHGCGEHSDIEPPEPSRMWIQPDPAVDDDDDIIFVPRSRQNKPTAEERRLADILEDADDTEDIVDDESAQNIQERAREDETQRDNSEETAETDDSTERGESVVYENAAVPVSNATEIEETSENFHTDHDESLHNVHSQDSFANTADSKDTQA